jgi:hypothetical protein
VVPGPHWRPEGEVTESAATVTSLGGLGRKP